jgi:hypothetical protein
MAGGDGSPACCIRATRSELCWASKIWWVPIQCTTMAMQEKFEMDFRLSSGAFAKSHSAFTSTRCVFTAGGSGSVSRAAARMNTYNIQMTQDTTFFENTAPIAGSIISWKSRVGGVYSWPVAMSSLATLVNVVGADSWWGSHSWLQPTLVGPGEAI